MIDSHLKQIIQALFLQKIITQIKDELAKYYGNSAPSISILKVRCNKLLHGRTSTSDAKCSRCPIVVITSETIEKIYDMVFANRRIKVREIVEAIGISHAQWFRF